MDVIRHDRPSLQTVADAIAVKHCCFQRQSDFRPVQPNIVSGRQDQMLEQAW